VPAHVDVSQRVKAACFRKHQSASPTVLPPSPIRAPKFVFCASNIGATLEAMTRHKDHAKIQEQGCRAIMELIKEDKRRRAESKEALEAKSRWKCMSCQFSNQQDDVRCRICSLPQQSTDTTAPSNQSRTNNNHIDDDRGGDQCRTTSSLTACEEIDQANGISLVVDAMRRFPSEKRLSKAACYALAQMNHEDPLLARKIAGCGGIGQLLTAMELLEVKQTPYTLDKGFGSSMPVSRYGFALGNSWVPM